MITDEDMKQYVSRWIKDRCDTTDWKATTPASTLYFDFGGWLMNYLRRPETAPRVRFGEELTERGFANVKKYAKHPDLRAGIQIRSDMNQTA